MPSVCVNPSCCNVDTFDGDKCPYCGDVMTCDIDVYMFAISERDAATSLVNQLHLDSK